MVKVARSRCLVCGGRDLRMLVNLSEEGALHGSEEHKFAYSYAIVASCGACGHGQLETYSHDCFSHYEDEAWNMYWWYALTPADVSQLRDALRHCPDSSNHHCGCSTHQQLRESAEHLSSDVRYVASPLEKVHFVWLSLKVVDQKIAFEIDPLKRPVAAATRSSWLRRWLSGSH